MPQEMTIAVHVGNLTFTFQTDKEGTNVERSIAAINRILSTKGRILRRVKTGVVKLNRDASTSTERESSRMKLSGKGETSIILRRIEKNLLPKGYFGSPRSTGDVKAALKEQTSIDR